MDYNPEIHHRKSIRLKGYDYSKRGAYFITSCTKDRVCLFGKIVDEEMILNEYGTIANEYLLDIPKHFPNVMLREHIVMPNHIHAIVVITDSIVGTIHESSFKSGSVPDVGTIHESSNISPNIPAVGTIHESSLQTTNDAHNRTIHESSLQLNSFKPYICDSYCRF